MSNTAKTVTLFSAVIVFGLLIGLLWPSPGPAIHHHPLIAAHKHGPRHVYEMADHTHAYQGDDGWWYWFSSDNEEAGTRSYAMTRMDPRTVSGNKVVREYEEENEEVEELGDPVVETEDKQEEMQESEPDQAEPSPEAAPATSSPAPSPAPEAPAEAAPAETGGTDSSSSDSGGGDGGGGGGCFR